MKKLKLAVLNDIGEVLTREELKKVFGGDESASGSGSTPKIEACKGKSSGSSCSFKLSNGATSYGRCVSLLGGPLHCSDFNY